MAQVGVVGRIGPLRVKDSFEISLIIMTNR